MNNFFTVILICLILNFTFLNNGNTNNPEVKINREFKEYFFENKDFFLLNEILSTEDKKDAIYALKSNSTEEKERVFNILLEENKEKIEKIGELKKAEIRNEEKSVREVNKNIENILGSQILKFIIAITFILVAAVYFLVAPINRIRRK